MSKCKCDNIIIIIIITIIIIIIIFTIILTIIFFIIVLIISTCINYSVIVRYTRYICSICRARWTKRETCAMNHQAGLPCLGFLVHHWSAKHDRTVGMMRLSSTYHLYKIALLVKTADAPKDSVILRSGEPSKALYFIVSGTVEVIQVRRAFLAMLFLCGCCSRRHYWRHSACCVQKRRSNASDRQNVRKECKQLQSTTYTYTQRRVMDIHTSLFSRYCNKTCGLLKANTKPNGLCRYLTNTDLTYASDQTILSSSVGIQWLRNAMVEEQRIFQRYEWGLYFWGHTCLIG